ncbi:MAG: bacteriohemerythrin [Candidatus Zixiibacteriota bacterium]
MSYMTWDKRFSVGIQELDDQHKRLIDLINALHDCRVKGPGGKCVGKLLDEIAEYIKTHFSYEEALMSKVNFPGFEEHQAEHLKIIQVTARFKRRVQSDSPPTAFELFIFLKRWLTEHILESDKVIGKYIANELAKQAVE